MYGLLLDQSIICNVPTSYNNDNKTASKDVLNFIQEKSNIFKIDQTENSTELIVTAFIEKFPCSKQFNRLCNPKLYLTLFKMKQPLNILEQKNEA